MFMGKGRVREIGAGEYTGKFDDEELLMVVAARSFWECALKTGCERKIQGKFCRNEKGLERGLQKRGKAGDEKGETQTAISTSYISFKHDIEE